MWSRMYSVPGKVLFESMAPTDVNDPDGIVDEDTNIEARDKEDSTLEKI